MPFKDVREFITKLEAEGQLRRIAEEVDWNLEVGAMVRWANEGGLPAPFFQQIKGYPEGYSILGSPVGTRQRMAIAMDIDKDVSQREMIEEYLRRRQQPIKPILVNDGPCKENIHVGDEVDLFKFPSPMVHEGDGGRYIGTFHATISRDLDSEWVNWSMYRHMLHTKNTLGILAEPYTHLGMVRSQKYEPNNKIMEVAIAIGTEPVTSICAAAPVPHGVSEVDIAGGIRGEAVEVVKCETVDLVVPATSEIVIEGEIRPNERMDEGTFGEYTGYVVGMREPRPVIHVKAITHRNNPILTMTNPGMPVYDGCVILSVTLAAEVLDELRARGLPVTGVSSFAETTQMLMVVAVKVPFANVAGEIAHIIWATRHGRSTPYVIVVEDDVDPFNLAEVLHALVTKCHPYRGIVRLEHTVAGGLVPFLNEYERKHLVGAKVYFDCTWPVDWDPSVVPTKSSFEKMYPSGVQQAALDKWSRHGY